MDQVDLINEVLVVDIVNVQDAKTHLSRLLHRVEGGESIVLARGGSPVARLGPSDGRGDRVLGFVEIGEISDSFLFDQQPEDELHEWES